MTLSFEYRVSVSMGRTEQAERLPFPQIPLMRMMNKDMKSLLEMAFFLSSISIENVPQSSGMIHMEIE